MAETWSYELAFECINTPNEFSGAPEIHVGQYVPLWDHAGQCVPEHEDTKHHHPGRASNSISTPQRRSGAQISRCRSTGNLRNSPIQRRALNAVAVGVMRRLLSASERCSMFDLKMREPPRIDIYSGVTGCNLDVHDLPVCLRRSSEIS